MYVSSKAVKVIASRSVELNTAVALEVKKEIKLTRKKVERHSIKLKTI